MRIAINAWFIDRPTTGSGQYLTHLLDEYAARYSVHTFLLCGHSHHEPSVRLAHRPDHVEWRTLSTPFDRVHRHLAKLWFEQVAFPRASHRWGAELIHVPYWASPLCAPLPVVVTIHDLIPLLLPAYQGGTLGRWYTRLVALTARRAAHVLTDSEAARQDIARYLHIPSARVQTVHLAADDRFGPVDDPRERDQARTKYALPDQYYLYLGGFDLRKNVPAIVDAYARLDRPEIDLVIAGKLPDRDTAFFPDPRRIARERGISDRVHFVGWVDEQDKPALYTEATAFIFPSHYEGFGLPPLEAMSCGTPVIVSDQSSLPEIVGQGGLCIAPDDLDTLARSMQQILDDRCLRERLRLSGLAQARRFSWRLAADATMAAYQRVLRARTSP
jgi:glycosyltransferase involved in cell wall biosynthesis